MTPFQGGCACGAIRYESPEPLNGAQLASERNRWVGWRGDQNLKMIGQESAAVRANHSASTTAISNRFPVAL